MSETLDFRVAIRKLETEAGETAHQLDEVTQKIRELGTIPLRRLMYGAWRPIKCCECESLENVHLYRLNGIHPKITVHLCDTCFQATPYASHIREWEPGDE
jgi:hypothetical protein